MNEHQLGVTPNDFASPKRYSQQANQIIGYLNELRIDKGADPYSYAGSSSGEAKIGKTWVDGYVKSERRVLEVSARVLKKTNLIRRRIKILGCWSHACMRHHKWKENQRHPLHLKSFRQVNSETFQRLELLRNHPEVDYCHFLWTCQIERSRLQPIIEGTNNEF